MNFPTSNRQVTLTTLIELIFRYFFEFFYIKPNVRQWKQFEFSNTKAKYFDALKLNYILMWLPPQCKYNKLRTIHQWFMLSVCSWLWHQHVNWTVLSEVEWFPHKYNSSFLRHQGWWWLPGRDSGEYNLLRKYFRQKIFHYWLKWNCKSCPQVSVRLKAGAVIRNKAI